MRNRWFPAQRRIEGIRWSVLRLDAHALLALIENHEPRIGVANRQCACPPRDRHTPIGDVEGIVDAA